jgi:Putative polyhydroxyalkanoic acid system protein (PHA_gran_rgn)
LLHRLFETRGKTLVNIQITVPFQISQADALVRIKDFIKKAKKEYGGALAITHDEWHGSVYSFAGNAKGFSGSGTIGVNEAQTTVELELPPAAMLFKGKIERAIREKLTEILRPSTTQV